RMTAGASSEMDYFGARFIHRLPSSLERTQAEIRVFPVHEKAFIETAERLEDFAPHHHARTGDPVDLGASCCDVGGRQVAPCQRIARRDPRQPRRAAAKRRTEIGKSSRRRLHAAVVFPDQSADNRGVWM